MSQERFKLVPAVHLFCIQKDKILLLRRYNTGFCDGDYSVVAGHLDGAETATNAMIREAREEVGIELEIDDMKMVHIMHRKKEKEERVDFFFVSNQWKNNPQNMEPNKCDDLRWFPIHNLPKNMVPYVKHGIECYLNSCTFSEFGFDRYSHHAQKIHSL